MGKTPASKRMYKEFQELADGKVKHELFLAVSMEMEVTN